MVKVNFVSEFNMIMRYSKNNGLSMRERMLWLSLFYIANDRAVYNEDTKEYEWHDDFMSISNGELNLYSCLDKRAVESLRNTLKQRGIIDFVPGLKKKRNPAYKINYLSINIGYKNVPNDVPNNAPYNVPNDVPNNAPYEAPLYKYNNILLNQSENDDDDDVVVESTREHARACETVAFQFQKTFGRKATTAEIEELIRATRLAGFDLAITNEALERAAKNGARSPIGYVKTLFSQWREDGVETVSDIEETEVLHSIAMGRDGYRCLGISQDEAFEKLRNWREAKRGVGA